MGDGVKGSQLPAWSIDREAALAQPLRSSWSLLDARDWAWGGSTGAGVSVAIIDSGIDAAHPAVGRVSGAVAVI